MKTIKNKSLLVVMVIFSLLPMNVFAQTRFYGDTIRDESGNMLYAFCYEITSSNTVSVFNIKRGSNDLNVVEIPEYVDYMGTRYVVDCIGYMQSSYNPREYIRRLVIPNTIKKIEKDAFKHSYNIAIDYDKYDPDRPITYDVRIRYLEIKDLDAWCRVELGNEYSHPLNHIHTCRFGHLLGSISCAYECEESHDIYLNGEVVKDVILPDDMDYINDYTFRGCNTIESINSKNGIKKVGTGALSACRRLTRINIAKTGLDYVGDVAFAYCTGLKWSKLLLNGDVGGGAFMGCNLSGLTELRLNGNIGSSAFYNCGKIPTVYIGEKATLNDGIFAGTKIEIMFIDCPKPPSVYVFSNGREYGGADVIYVPDEALSAYKKSVYWKDYNIQPKSSWVAPVAFESGGVRYQIISNTTVEVISKESGDLYSGSVLIPEKVTYEDRDFTVTSISPNAFIDCENLTDISLPESITTIYDGTFKGCRSLRNVNIPNSVTSVGVESFSGCNSLSSVTVGKNVKSFGSDAFYGCSNLTEIVYNATNCVTISSVFANHTSINKVLIGEEVTNLPGNIFKGCTGLTEINIPSSVTKIGRYAFLDCTGLTEVSIPNSVTLIEGDAFSGCTGLKEISIPNSIISIRTGTFSGCTGLTEVNIPSSVTTIGNKAFSGCTGLTEIDIPEGVSSIGDEAFYDCSNLKEITIPNSVVSVGQYAFRGCDNLEEVRFNAENCLSMTQSFYGSSFSTLTIGDRVINIPNEAFSSCKGIENLTIPASVVYIGNNSFYNCSNLKELIFNAEKCYYMGTENESAFNGCTSLKNVTIEKGVKNIPGYAFYECEGLMNVTISSSVEKIGTCAFYDCYNIRTVTSKRRTPPQCEDKVFYNVKTESCTLTVQSESVSLYQEANGWRDFWNITGTEFSGIGDIEVDESGDAPTVYYNLQGVRVENPENGIFIKKQAGKTTKVVM